MPKAIENDISNETSSFLFLLKSNARNLIALCAVSLASGIKLAHLSSSYFNFSQLVVCLK